jgi:hypothetical protein
MTIGACRRIRLWRTADNPPRNGEWVTPRGDVQIYVGSSSEDSRLEGSMLVR